MSRDSKKSSVGGLSRLWQRQSKSSQWPSLDESAPQGLDGQRFRAASSRQRVVVAVGVVGLLAAIIGIALLFSHMPAIGMGPVSANGSATATAAASATATNTPAFALAFTCASGTIKQTAKVCLHTVPKATVTLSVRYCDGTYAGGRDLNGSYTADSSGNFIFLFAVHTHCAGKATATATAKSSGRTVTKSTTFTINR